MVIKLITGHEIKKEGEKEVLILHLNYDVEFSLDFYKRKSGKSMRQLVKEYIKKGEITWNGNKIILFFGGIALGTLLLVNTPVREEQLDYAYVNNEILDHTEEVFYIPNEPEEEIPEKIENKQETTVVMNPSLNEKEEIKNNSNTSTENSTKPIQKPSSQKTDQIVNQTQQNDEQKVEPPQSIEEEIKDFEQSVTIYRKNGSILTLSMTDYLIGVVAAEMPASFPKEALKAQSIVARTYALKKLAVGGRLTDDVSTQVYRDETYLRSIWKKDYDLYYNKIKTAVRETDGLVVKYNGSYIEAIYHSTSNGKTEDAVNVWGNTVPYLKSVDSSWDQSASTYLRTVEMDLNSIFQIFGIDFSSPISIDILSRNASGRIESIRVGNQNYSGVEVRNLLGLRSSDFDIEIQNGKLMITTRGYGHGVGMSQYGAKGMAAEGYSYKQILSHYYPGTYLEKVN